jgi:hypothetical protein
MKDMQYNGQMKKDKRTTNNLQNTTQKTKDRAIRNTLLFCVGIVPFSNISSD